jgi:NAD(P)H-hydrate epimerase
LGTHEARKALLESVIQRGGKLLLDADALTILSEDPTLLKRVPKGSIFTPHPGEFQRLFGFTVEDSQFIEKGRALAVGLGIHLLAKNKYSTYFSAEGEVIVSDLGNSSLAQGGSGDRLTGIIAAWWAKTQDAKTAVIAGQFKLTK